VPVSLPADRSAITTGTLRDTGEARTYRCGACARSSIVKSNTALVKEYARLNARYRRANSEHCQNPECINHGVRVSLMRSAYVAHGKTASGDPRFRCRGCGKTFSIGLPTRRHRETTDTGTILKLLVNKMPIRRIAETCACPPTRIYDKIEFLAEQCRKMSAAREAALPAAFRDRRRALSVDTQTLLVNWPVKERIMNVPILHLCTVEASSGYVVAATTDHDVETDAVEIEQAMAA
jgi:transposase-like protein